MKIIIFFLFLTALNSGTYAYSQDMMVAWDENYYVDDFGDKTSENYHQINVNGDFSNAIYDNLPLKGAILINGSESQTLGSVFLYEYKTLTVKNTLTSRTTYQVKVKYNSDKNKHNTIYYKFHLSYNKNSDRMLIESAAINHLRFIKDLKSGGKFTIVFKGVTDYNGNNKYILRFKTAPL